MHIGNFTSNTAQKLELKTKYLNRHGLIAGATGTGKTITLQKLAECFSNEGISVFLSDVKGDLSGISGLGGGNKIVEDRLQKLGVTDYEYASNPSIFWDLFGQRGHPIRTTVSEMGPVLLSQLMELNEVQSGILNIAFAVADAQGLLLIDLKDLISTLNFIAENAAEYSKQYGNISKTSVATIVRTILGLQQQGADNFFGEPAFDVQNFIKTDKNGKGYINILSAEKLVNSPKFYAIFLLWMLSELFENLPEAGDLEKPKLAFFFDEAHLLFDNAPKHLLEKIEQVVRLIRSKAVGVYFITQSPSDVPEDVLGQLGNRFQHALRAFTPKDQKAVKTAAQTFRPNPKLNVEQAITELAVGEALVSVLEDGGVPSITERVLICPPFSKIGPVNDVERNKTLNQSPYFGVYDEKIESESAYEILKARSESQPESSSKNVKSIRPQPQQVEEEQSASSGFGFGGILTGTGSNSNSSGGRGGRVSSGGYKRQTIAEAAAKSVVRSVVNTIGREIVRGVLGNILKR